MTVITGVSGSGKTSLLDRVIYASRVAGRAVCCKEIAGWEHFSDLIYIGQSLQGTGYQATAGSLLGLSGVIAGIYAGADGSRERKFKTSHFTAGSRDGRCPDCEGTGLNRVSLDFFADAVTPCERCGGTGFRDEVLEVMIDGQTIYDALHISFKDLSRFIEAHQRSKPDQKTNILLNLIEKTGLGHLTGGRLLKTLSTGELQRLKLVSGLASKTGTNTLILLDEPTGGLHPKDIERLLKLFDELLQSGNTIVCVTHEPLLINSASCVVEFGPGGGRNGGRIVTRDA